MAVLYQVPGLIELRAQPSPNTCWATACTMMLSWKKKASYEIREAMRAIDVKYENYFNNDKGLPTSEFGTFLRAAGISHLPQVNLSIEGWVIQLNTHGLTWVGTMNSPSPLAGLHSRLVEGIRGDGSPQSTHMMIIDPSGGRRYDETFRVFVSKYEKAFETSHDDQYFQIRFF